MKRLCVLLGLLSAAAAIAASQEKLTVDRAVQEAVQRNLSLMAERYNVPIAEAAVMTARLRPNPVFSSGTDYLDAFGTGFSSSNSAGPSEVNFRTDFLLERGGKRERRIDLAEKSMEVAKAQFLDATRLLVLDVRNACIDLLMAKENLALAQDTLNSFTAIVEINTNRVKAGDLAEVELVRSRVAALQYRNAQIQAESKLRVARNRLQTLLGRPTLSPDFDLTGELRGGAEPASLDSLKIQALERRPDLQALIRDRQRIGADLLLQQANGKVDYTVGTQFHRQFYNGVGSALGLFVSVPLPVWNRNQGEIERARRQGEQSEARIRAREADIRTDVENAFAQYRTAQELLRNIEKEMLDQAREVRQTTEYSYRRGEASFVEFLDAQRAFNDTMQSYNEAKAEYSRALYLIESATGKAVNP